MYTLQGGGLLVLLSLVLGTQEAPDKHVHHCFWAPSGWGIECLMLRAHVRGPLVA